MRPRLQGHTRVGNSISLQFNRIGGMASRIPPMLVCVCQVTVIHVLDIMRSAEIRAAQKYGVGVLEYLYCSPTTATQRLC